MVENHDRLWPEGQHSIRESVDSYFKSFVALNYYVSILVWFRFFFLIYKDFSFNIMELSSRKTVAEGL